MKNKMKLAAAMAVLATPAFAVQNMENPLFLPSAGNVYSKTAVGLMYKKAGSNDALRLRGIDGQEEFPIWRGYQELGVGVTDRLAIRGKASYTQDDDIGRKGLTEGRLGALYRIFDGKSTDGIVFDVYADAFLGGLSKMTGTMTFIGTPADRVYAMNYDNYSTGQYGAFGGFQVGKTWDKLTGAVFAEVGYYLPNDNTEIDVAIPGAAPGFGTTPTGTATAKLKSSMDYNAGLKFVYDFAPKWTSGASFTYKHRGAHVLDSVTISNVNPAAAAAAMDLVAAGMAGKSFKDNYEEYILGLMAANQLNDYVQVALYGEYTLDDGGSGSQNVTDLKVELGARLNVQF